MSYADLIKNIIDILLVTVLAYQAYRLLRHSRATPVLIGMAILFIISLFSRLVQLETVTWLFESVSSYILITVIVILQPELRRMFYQIGQARWYRLLFKAQEIPVDEILQASHQLAEEKTGALIVVVNQIGLRHISEGGIMLQGKVSRELLLSIFYGKNPLHDGAVILEGSQLISAATYLPLSSSTKLKKTHGARHRAGLGISEESDALAIIVSEEKGKISLCYMNDLQENIDTIKLKSLLTAFNNDRLDEEWASFFK